MLREYGSSCESKLSELARRTGVVKDGYDDSETAAMFIEWVQEMNDYMDIPRHIPEIQACDIPVMAKHADAEANPLYPVPKLMSKKELAAMYEIIGG